MLNKIASKIVEEVTYTDKALGLGEGSSKTIIILLAKHFIKNCLMKVIIKADHQISFVLLFDHILIIYLEVSIVLLNSVNFKINKIDVEAKEDV